MNHSTLTLREYNGIQIPQRPDGYINATKMCQAGGKQWSNFIRLQSANAYVEALEIDLQMCRSKIILTVQGRGDTVEQGTWVHPDLGIEVARWISPEFAILTNRWTQEIISGRSPLPVQKPIAALPSSEERLRTIRFGMDLLQDLGGIDDRTRLALQDLTRNILLEDRLKQPALPSGERFEWNISDRAAHLGYRPKSGDLTKIGKIAAQLYRTRHGKNPPKHEQYVGGTTRMVNFYSSNDLDILDEEIGAVMGRA
ncbi:MAG: KilA-N domain-containing protein [Leptolyngbya sp. SIO1D8]|nr:KilA-N domain-containing protein [Leptolyngbya sp. SIO1D8]